MSLHLHRLLGILTLASAAMASEAFLSSVGCSHLVDPSAAGLEAAKAARDGLRGEPPRLVFVFAARPQMGDALVQGVASVFPPNVIFGGEFYAPLAGNEDFADQGVGIKAGIAVLAMAGSFRTRITSAEVPATGDRTFRYGTCGSALGHALRPGLDGPEPGKAVITFGQQHTGDNEPFAKALTNALAHPEVPVIGGGVPGGTNGTIIVEGQRRTGCNVAIAICGQFTCTTGHGEPGGEPLEQTRQALQQGTASGKIHPRLILAFHSRTVREQLLQRRQLTSEVALLTQMAGPGVLFGGYGSGQVVPPAWGEPSIGRGHLLALAVFSTP